MTTRAIIISVSVVDDDGDKSSVPIYGTFDDATATLSSIGAYAAGRAIEVDEMTGGKVTGLSTTLYQPIPGGLKADPIAGSDVERGAVLSFNLSGLAASHSYGIEIPALLQALYTGDIVNDAAEEIQNFIATMTATNGTVLPTEDNWLSHLNSFRKGVKSFRKHR